jgi:hypothetical protein
MAESTRSTVEEDIWDFLDTEDISEVHSTSKTIEHSPLSFIGGTSASEFQEDLEVDLDGQFSLAQQRDDTSQDAASHHMLELENMLLGSSEFTIQTVWNRSLTMIVGLGVLPTLFKVARSP